MSQSRDATPAGDVNEAQSAGIAAPWLLDAIADVVAARDAGGRVVYVNAAFRRAFGGREEDWRGRRLDFAPRRSLSATSGRRRIDLEVETVEGRVCFEWEETPLPGGGSIGVGRDVSARRANEAALRNARAVAEDAARARETLFATITHELRTPVIGVLGMADLLRATELKPEQRAYIGAIMDSGRHLLGLVDDVLDAAKLESGAFALALGDVDLAELLRSVAELVSPRARSKGLETAVYLDPTAPRTIRADEARLRQVLLNLAGNAVKFTEQGAVVIAVEREGGGEDEAILSFNVRDTGPGVPEAERVRVFEAFAQSSVARSNGVEGAGLGLAIVKRLVDAMDGEISLDAPPEGGSEFKARIRFAVVDDADAAASTRLNGVRAIVAAPHGAARAAMARQLRAFGADVEACAEAAALNAALKTDPDRVALIDAVFARGPAPKARAALVMAAPDQRSDLSSWLAAGYAGWIVKPPRPDALAVHTLRAWRGEPAPDAADSLGDTGERALLPAFDARGLKVLLVEDNPVNRVLAQTLLARLGADTVTAETGPAAVEAAAGARRLDLILMDMRLPGFDGIEATRRIRAQGGAGAEAPIVALTANASEEDKRACIAAGMNDFLTKPLDADALASAFARWTKRAKPGQAPGL